MNKQTAGLAIEETKANSGPDSPRLPLRGWALELARRWNGGTYSLFVLHGNIFDLFPVQDASGLIYVPLKTFLVRRLFPERACLLFYDISDGLTFGSSDMQKRFFEWLEIYDNVENTNFHQVGPPRDFIRVAPLLRRFFLRVAEEKEYHQPPIPPNTSFPRRGRQTQPPTTGEIGDVPEMGRGPGNGKAGYWGH